MMIDVMPVIPWATLAISLANPVDTNLFSVSMTRSDIPALYILADTSRISSLQEKANPEISFEHSKKIQNGGQRLLSSKMDTFHITLHCLMS
jgi:hypothetical protein